MSIVMLILDNTLEMNVDIDKLVRNTTPKARALLRGSTFFYIFKFSFYINYMSAIKFSCAMSAIFHAASVYLFNLMELILLFSNFNLIDSICFDFFSFFVIEPRCCNVRCVMELEHGIVNKLFQDMFFLWAILVSVAIYLWRIDYAWLEVCGPLCRHCFCTIIA